MTKPILNLIVDGRRALTIDDAGGFKPWDESKVKRDAGGKFSHMGGWQKTGGQLGSNPGGKFADPDGKEHYDKFSKSEAHAKNEHLAEKLYQLAGSPVLHSHLIDTKAGGGSGLGTASPWQEGTKFDHKNADHLKQAHADFATHAWLANWDAVGQSIDNLKMVNGKPHLVDAGGALLFRAQGEKKGAAFGDEVGEWDSLRKGKNAQAAAVFGSMTPEAMIASAEKVVAIPEKDIRATVMKFGPGSEAAREELADTLVMRKASLDDKLQALKAQQAKAKKDDDLANFKLHPEPDAAQALPAHLQALVSPAPAAPAAPASVNGFEAHHIETATKAAAAIRPDPKGYKDPALGNYVDKRLKLMDEALASADPIAALNAVGVNKYHPKLHAYRTMLINGLHGAKASAPAAPAPAPAPMPITSPAAPAASPGASHPAKGEGHAHIKALAAEEFPNKGPGKGNPWTASQQSDLLSLGSAINLGNDLDAYQPKTLIGEHLKNKLVEETKSGELSIAPSAAPAPPTPKSATAKAPKAPLPPPASAAEALAAVPTTHLKHANIKHYLEKNWDNPDAGGNWGKLAAAIKSGDPHAIAQTPMSSPSGKAAQKLFLAQAKQNAQGGAKAKTSLPKAKTSLSSGWQQVHGLSAKNAKGEHVAIKHYVDPDKIHGGEATSAAIAAAEQHAQQGSNGWAPSTGALDKLYDDYGWQNYNNLPGTQKSASNAYQGAYSGAMNKHMAGIKDGGHGIAAKVSAFKEALDKSVIPHDLELHRGVRTTLQELTGFQDVNDAVGGIFEHKGFVSSSRKEATARSFGSLDSGYTNSVLMKFTMPKGSKGYVMPGHHHGSKAKHTEYEVVLPPSAMFRIDKVEHDPMLKNHIVHCSYLGERHVP